MYAVCKCLNVELANSVLVYIYRHHRRPKLSHVYIENVCLPAYIASNHMQCLPVASIIAMPACSKHNIITMLACTYL